MESFHTRNPRFKLIVLFQIWCVKAKLKGKIIIKMMKTYIVHSRLNWMKNYFTSHSLTFLLLVSEIEFRSWTTCSVSKINIFQAWYSILKKGTLILEVLPIIECYFNIGLFYYFQYFCFSRLDKTIKIQRYYQHSILRYNACQFFVSSHLFLPEVLNNFQRVPFWISLHKEY